MFTSWESQVPNCPAYGLATKYLVYRRQTRLFPLGYPWWDFVPSRMPVVLRDAQALGSDKLCPSPCRPRRWVFQAVGKSKGGE